MCGRYQFTAEQSAEILRIIREVELRCGHGHWHPGEIYPSAKAPVLLNSAGETTADLMRWGYKFPSGLVINARAETAMEKPLFRDTARSCTAMLHRAMQPMRRLWSNPSALQKCICTFSS